MLGLGPDEIIGLLGDHVSFSEDYCVTMQEEAWDQHAQFLETSGIGMKFLNFNSLKVMGRTFPSEQN